MSGELVPPEVAEYREPGLSRAARALWRDDPETQGRPLWELFPPKADRCKGCGYRLDAPGHASAMHEPEGCLCA